MSMNVLIVDDAAFVREILGNLCREMGHYVVGEAADGTQAIEMAKKLKPQVIFLDLVLPKKNGLDVAEEILQATPAVKIVAVSTLARVDFEPKALAAGCFAYMAKPFTRKDLSFIFESLSTPQRMVQNG